MEQIKFKDLSLALKLGILGGLLNLVASLIYFGIGFIQGLMGV